MGRRVWQAVIGAKGSGSHSAGCRSLAAEPLRCPFSKMSSWVAGVDMNQKLNSFQPRDGANCFSQNKQDTFMKIAPKKKHIYDFSQETSARKIVCTCNNSRLALIFPLIFFSFGYYLKSSIHFKTTINVYPFKVLFLCNRNCLQGAT